MLKDDKDFKFLILMIGLSVSLFISIILNSGCIPKEPDAFRDSVYWRGE